VLEVGRRDDDGVEILHVGEELAVILVGDGLVAELLEEALGAREIVGPDVAHRLEADARDREGGVGEDAALLAATDEGDVDLISFGAGLGGAGDVGAAAMKAPSFALVLRKSRREMEEGRSDMAGVGGVGAISG